MWGSRGVGAFSADFSKSGARLRSLWRAPKSDYAEQQKGLTFWYINISLDENLKWSIFIILFAFNQAVKHIIYLI